MAKNPPRLGYGKTRRLRLPKSKQANSYPQTSHPAYGKLGSRFREAAVLDDYLELHYTMDSEHIDGTTVEDQSGNSRDGTTVNNPVLRNGPIAQSLALNGVNQRISVPLAAWPGINGSLSFWARVDTGLGNVRIFSTDHTSGSVYEHRTVSEKDGQIAIYMSDGSRSSGSGENSTFTYGTWHHVVFTWEWRGEYTTIKTYVDGLIGLDDEGDPWISNALTASVSAPDAAIDIGFWDTGFSQTLYYDGRVDDFRLYSCVLTESDVDTLYALGSTITTTTSTTTTTTSSILPGSGQDVYLTMDNAHITGATLEDQSGNDRDGTMVNAPITGGDGPIAESIALDGVDQHATVPIASWPGTSGSLSMWANVTDNTGNVRIFATEHSSGGNYEHRFSSAADGSLYIYMANGSGTVQVGAASGFSYGIWHHVVFTWEYDGSTETTITLYVDGVVFGSADTIAGTVTTPEGIYIGRFNADYLKGSVDDFRLYDHILTSGEINVLCDMGDVVMRGLKVYYTMDDANIDGATLKDVSVNARDATMHNAPGTGKVGPIGEAVRFKAASSEYVGMLLTEWPGTSGSIAFWGKMLDNAGNGRFVGTGHSNGANSQHRTYSDGDGKLLWYMSNGSNNTYTGTSDGFSYNVWHHVTLTWEYDGSTLTTITMYLDGSAVGIPATLAGTVITPDDSFKIGSWTVNFSNVLVDDFRVYSRVLDGDDATALYNLGSLPATTTTTTTTV